MATRKVLNPSNPPMEVHTTIQMPPQAAEEKKADEKPDFWTYMQSLTPEQWKNHIVYLTRENPKTSINGIGGYLTKLMQPFDIEDIKTAYGGYEFSYIMKKANDLIYGGRFKVEAPPKYDPARENANQNAAVGTGVLGTGTTTGDVLKVLEQQNNRLYEVLTTLQTAKDDNPAIKSAVEILTTAYKTGLTAVATQPNGGDPSEQLDSVIGLAERIISVRGGGGNSLQETITLLTTLGVIAKPKSLAEQLQEIKTLNELISGGGETPKDWKAMGVKALVDHLPEILETFRTSAAGTIAAAQARTRPQAPPPSRPAPPARPAAAPVPPAATAAPPAPAINVTGGLQVVPRESEDFAAAPAAVEAMPAAELPTTQEEYDSAMKIQLVNMMRLGSSGASIASFLEDVKPEMAKDLVKYPRNVIEEFFLKDPYLKLMVEDPRWGEVFTDAREYLAEEVTVN